MNADRRAACQPVHGTRLRQLASACLLAAMLATGCAANARVQAGGDAALPMAPEPHDRWLTFSGTVVRQTPEQVVLRDAGGMEVVLPAPAVRTTGGKIEVLVGAIAEMPGPELGADGLVLSEPSEPSELVQPPPPPPPPPPAAPPPPPPPKNGGTEQATAAGTPSTACLGLIRIDCSTGKVIGICSSVKVCP